MEIFRRLGAGRPQLVKSEVRTSVISASARMATEGVLRRQGCRAMKLVADQITNKSSVENLSERRSGLSS